MKSKIQRLSYRIGLHNQAIAKVFRETKDREYGVFKPLTSATIRRIENLTYNSRNFKTQAVLSQRSIAIYIRLKKDQS